MPVAEAKAKVGISYFEVLGRIGERVYWVGLERLGEESKIRTGNSCSGDGNFATERAPNHKIASTVG